MSFRGVQIIKGEGGLGRREPSDDAVMGLIISSDREPDLQYEQIATFNSLKDAENYNITFTEYPEIWYHISEFFRLCPNGTLVYMTVELKSYSDIANQHFEDFVKSKEGKKVKSVGVLSFKTSSWSNGIELDLQAGISAFQQKVDVLRLENIFVDSVVLGAVMQLPISPSLPDLSGELAPNISVVIAEDNLWRGLVGRRCPAVGTVLGSIAVRKVCESIGSVDIISKPESKLGKPNYSLVDDVQERWVQLGISDNNTYSLTTADKLILTAKKYIYEGSYEGYPGVYFNDSPTCTSLSSDYAYIENNRVINKASRIVVNILTPFINSTVDIDPNTGYINYTTIASWEQAVNNAIGNMLKDEEISGFTFSIDPKQNVLSGASIETYLAIVPKGIAREINATISFSNPLK